MNIDAELKIARLRREAAGQVKRSCPPLLFFSALPVWEKVHRRRSWQRQPVLPHISSGDLFRENMKLPKPTWACWHKSYMNKGELVPDDVTIGMIRARLHLPDCKNGALLDGFPTHHRPGRSPGDNCWQNSTGKWILCLTLLPLKRSWSSDWADVGPAGRMGISFTRRIILPRQQVCVIMDGSELYQREDDKSETVVHRIQVYFKQTAPLIDYYRKQGLLTEIDGTQSIEKVTASLLAIIE